MNLLITILFGMFAGYSFNMFYGIELSPLSFCVALVGFSRLGFKLHYRHFYAFGVAFHFVSLFWISYSFEFIHMFWLGPIALFLGALVLGLIFPISLFFQKRLYVPWVVAFSMIEWLRSFHGLGMPWNHLAFCAEPLYGFLPTFGTYGLSFIMLCLSQIQFMPTAMKIFLITFTSCSSIVTTSDKFDEIRYHKDHKIRIVQPCLDIFSKWTPEKWEENKQLYLLLSTENAKDIDLYIWPEAAIPFCAHTYQGSLKELVSFLPEKAQLVLGHPRFFGEQLKVSMSVVDHLGVITDYYDKRILVPFGEYIPFNIPLPKMTFGTFPYSSGDFAKQGLQFKGKPKWFDAAPLICYETAFGWLLKRYRGAWILSITNDAWFGNSVGPYQHLHIARMRAIEFQRTVVRCANNGISAVIARNGIIVKHLPLNTVGYMDFYRPYINWK